MIRRYAAAALTACAFAVFGCTGYAQAQTEDERFVEAVDAMGITVGPDVDLPAVGQGVCDTLTEGLATSVNPVPVVRGVVASLQNSNLTREQAVGMLQAAVSVYCPQHIRSIGR